MNSELLQVRGVAINTPAGRPLFRDLTMALEHGDHVALIGRNGVGKSSLLAVLAESVAPAAGRIVCHGRSLLVPQRPEGTPGSRPSTQSPGEAQRQRLEVALRSGADLLLLDEPTHDLDSENIEWLVDTLPTWQRALVVVSHDRRLLRLFRDFFVVSETGCRHFRGDFTGLMADIEQRNHQQEKRYVQSLHRLADKERHNATVRRRRQRKKNLGRVRELGRCPSRGRLNENRSYAQESQGKRAVLQRARIDHARQWAKVTRRALEVNLPLEAVLPHPPEQSAGPVATLHGVTAKAGDRVLLDDLTLQTERQRLAIVGSNGAGKTTLVEILTGNREPCEGHVTCDAGRLGYIAQNSSNWCLGESLVEQLADGEGVAGLEKAASTLQAHKFPFALAERPLAELSPGERLRAAIICLFQRSPAPELLVLDEPTDHLDFLGVTALEAVLSAWRGGLVVVSHDEDFLDAIGIQERLQMGSASRRSKTQSVHRTTGQ